MAKKATKKAVKAAEEKISTNVVNPGAEEKEAEMHIESESKDVIKPEEVEESISEEKLEKEIKKVEEKMIIGKVRNKVYQKTSFIKMKSLRSYPCNYELPDNIRKYLNNKGWGANIIEKDEQWLVKHRADLEIIEELKKFLSEHYF